MNRSYLQSALFFMLSMSMLTACHTIEQKPTETKSTSNNMNQLPQNENDWKEKLSPEQYRVLRLKGTERPGTGIYDQHWDSGTYVCAGCGSELFHSSTKFDAHCGWPSFYESIDKNKITEKTDLSHGMIRTEVLCANCGGHLGHVFNDGPKPTGMRYCINSVSLGFIRKE